MRWRRTTAGERDGHVDMARDVPRRSWRAKIQACKAGRDPADEDFAFHAPRLSRTLVALRRPRQRQIPRPAARALAVLSSSSPKPAITDLARSAQGAARPPGRWQHLAIGARSTTPNHVSRSPEVQRAIPRAIAPLAGGYRRRQCVNRGTSAARRHGAIASRRLSAAFPSGSARRSSTDAGKIAAVRLLQPFFLLQTVLHSSTAGRDRHARPTSWSPRSTSRWARRAAYVKFAHRRRRTALWSAVFRSPRPAGACASPGPGAGPKVFRMTAYTRPRWTRSSPPPPRSDGIACSLGRLNSETPEASAEYSRAPGRLDGAAGESRVADPHDRGATGR